MSDDKEPHLLINKEAQQIYEDLLSVVREELVVRIAAGDLTAENADSVEVVSEVISDAVLHCFVVRPRNADEELYTFKESESQRDQG